MYIPLSHKHLECTPNLCILMFIWSIIELIIFILLYHAFYNNLYIQYPQKISYVIIGHGQFGNNTMLICVVGCWQCSAGLRQTKQQMSPAHCFLNSAIYLYLTFSKKHAYTFKHDISKISN